jgi:hypothetical protein
VKLPVKRENAAGEMALLLVGIVLLFGCGREETRIPPAPQGPAGRGPSPLPASNLSLYPEKPDVRTGVRAVLSGSPGGASPSVKRIRWFINGTEYSTPETGRLPGSMIRRGDVVAARAEIESGGKAGEIGSAEVTVRNSHPEILSADLSDPAPRKGMEVRAVASGKDADGDPVTFRYRWFLNGREVPGETASALTLAGVDKGTWLHAEVQATDDIDLGSRAFTPKVRVVNTPPAVSQIIITKGSGGRFTANVGVRDVDGDRVTVAAKSLPRGVELNERALSWEENADRTGRETPVVLSLSDGDGGEIEYSFFLFEGKK